MILYICISLNIKMHLVELKSSFPLYNDDLDVFCMYLVAEILVGFQISQFHPSNNL